MHSHTAPSMTRLQKIVELKLTQCHGDALTSVVFPLQMCYVDTSKHAGSLGVRIKLLHSLIIEN